MLADLRKRQKELVLAHDGVGEAFSHYANSSDEDAAMTRLFADIRSRLKDKADATQRELTDRESEVIGRGLLQVNFSARGEKARLVISRPDTRCDDPYVMWEQWRGLLAILGYVGNGQSETFPAAVKSDRDFEVVVLNSARLPAAVCTKDGTRELKRTKI